MSRATHLLAMTLTLLIATGPWPALAETRRPSSVPEGVTIGLAVEQDSFRVGERIPVTLSFDAGETDYRIDTYRTRTGSCRALRFRIEGPEGGARDLTALDGRWGPVSTRRGTGPRETLKESFDLNAWFRFDEPGQYFLTGWIWLSGSRLGEPSTEIPAGEISFEILPRDVELERTILAEADTAPADDPDEECEGARVLRYLATREALSRMVPLFNSRCAQQAFLGFAAARDRAHAKGILESGLAEPGRAVDYHYMEALAWLSVRPALFEIDLNADYESLRPQLRELDRELKRVRERSLGELTELFSNKTGRARIAALQVLLGRNPQGASAELCIAAAAVYPELEELERRSILARRDLRCPQIEEIAASILRDPPDSSRSPNAQLYTTAVMRYAEDRPALVREEILDDLLRPRPLLYRSIRPEQLPETLPDGVEDIIVDNMIGDGDVEALSFVLASAGTGRHVDRIVEFYSAREGRWACHIQNNFLRYWIRHDREQGLPAVRRAMGLREPTRCYTSTLHALQDRWGMDSEAMTVAYLRDADPYVVTTALRVLGKSGSDGVVDPLLELLLSLREVDEFRFDDPRTHFTFSSVRHEIVQLFLSNNGWSLSPEQQQLLRESLRTEEELSGFKRRFD